LSYPGRIAPDSDSMYYSPRSMSKRACRLLSISVFTALVIITAWSNSPLKLIPHLPEVLGFRGPRKYLVILQNNNELRPTGGFMGSFAAVSFDRGKMAYSVNDIYEPDGLVTSHINSPPPIQEAFQLGTWRLRDANWDPDFPSSVKTIEWFMGKAGLSGINGVATINLTAVEKMLGSLGTVTVAEYRETITEDNVWEKAQSYSQDNYFPGSKQKKEFLASLSKAVIDKYNSLNLFSKLKLLGGIINQLNQKQILIYFHNSSIQKTFSSLNWTGEIKQPTCPWWVKKCIADAIIVVEANLGVNKANHGVIRTADLTIIPEGDKIHHRLILNFENKKSDNKWGGKYKAWVRIIFPDGEKGFWIDLPEGETKTETIEYDTQATSPNSKIYSFLWQKQSGIDYLPITLTVNKNKRSRVIHGNLTGDKLLVL